MENSTFSDFPASSSFSENPVKFSDNSGSTLKDLAASRGEVGGAHSKVTKA